MRVAAEDTQRSLEDGRVVGDGDGRPERRAPYRVTVRPGERSRRDLEERRESRRVRVERDAAALRQVPAMDRQLAEADDADHLGRRLLPTDRGHAGPGV